MLLLFCHIGHFRSSKSLFGVESMGDGTVIITADNGNCLYNKQTGSILSNLENREAATRFTIRMINRPFLILKCDFGFVGLKSATSTKPELVCNKTTYGVTFLEPQDDGKYYMKGRSGWPCLLFICIEK